jgi:DNA modification methylase
MSAPNHTGQNPPAHKNQLFYGDNLEVLRRHIPDSSVDLIYLDPPFNSRQDYNVLFAEKDGNRSASQITAFKDTWEWNEEAARSYEEVVEQGGRVAEAMRAFRTLLGGSDMLAYLAMMAPRLVELRRVLKPTGSIYLHCDPTASHYLKLLMDSVFGPALFHSEIIWKRNSAHSDAQRFGAVHDTILFYSKTDKTYWNTQYQAYAADYVEQYYRYKDANGRRFMSGDLGAAGLQGGGYEYEWKGVQRVWRVPQATMERLDSEARIFYTKNGIPRVKRYLDESKGMPAQDIWTDIESLKSWMAERLGYPTQKPEALLSRIIQASSKEGDVVLDPFCGCGTTIQVAQKTGRSWIGIDITHLAIGLIKFRLDNTFGPEIRTTYKVTGEPKDVAGAARLASENKYQFQDWALGLCGARREGQSKKGADRGIDGRLPFHEARGGETKQIIFSVKGGLNIGVSEVRDLIGVLQREKAEIGVYISFAEPTRPMKTEAAEAGFYTSQDGSKYPRIQLLTIKGLLEGTQRLERPLHVRDVTFKAAPRHRPEPARNLSLNLEGSGE